MGKVIRNSAAASKEYSVVRNAGIVILNNYIEILFDRLKLTENKQFSSKENQINAVHCLQYLITGLNSPAEIYLNLNKILCGVSISDTVPDAIKFSNEETHLMNSMLEAVISHTSVTMGQSTIDGFRGNWFVRDGRLAELEDKWELTVERRSYDILLHRSPLSFSIIKYNWMSKPLYVNWS